MGGELGSNSGHASAQVTHSPAVTLGHSACINLERQNSAFDKGGIRRSSVEMFYMMIMVRDRCGLPLSSEYCIHIETGVIYIFSPRLLRKPN